MEVIVGGRGGGGVGREKVREGSARELGKDGGGVKTRKRN
jgi:hypothetical protein